MQSVSKSFIAGTVFGLGAGVAIGVAQSPSQTTPTGGDTEYAFVLVEDLSTDMSGESPGADIDAISVTISGAETFASGITDFGLGGGSNLDPNQALGAPDSGCMATNFVSLGGTGGYARFVAICPSDTWPS